MPDLTVQVINETIAVKPTSPAGQVWASQNLKEIALSHNLHAWIIAPCDLADIFRQARNNGLSCIYESRGTNND